MKTKFLVLMEGTSIGPPFGSLDRAKAEIDEDGYDAEACEIFEVVAVHTAKVQIANWTRKEYK